MKNHFPLYIFTILLFCVLPSFAQGEFSFPKGITKNKISVEIVSNIVIVPVNVNGTDLNFILDTGASGTIIFQLDAEQQIEAKNAEYIDLKGAGNGDPIKAIKSKDNSIKIGEAQSNGETMYVIVDDEGNFSPQLGFAVQGIIGYELFKDFIVEINYLKKHITLHSPNTYVPKVKKKDQIFPLEFYRNRPYLSTNITLEKEQIPALMLLDSGASDALWVFQDTAKNIKLPPKNFNDFLGMGLNGPIKGQRAYTKSLDVGPFHFKNVTTAFPDSTSVQNLHVNKKRNGSIGADFLQRFHTTINYPQKKLTIRSNRNYDNPFLYNKSGLTIQHGEYTLAKKLIESNDKNLSRANEYTSQIVNIFKSETRYRTVLQPTYEIADVRQGSPAEKVGLQKGDFIIAINGRKTERMGLSDITKFFYQESEKLVRIRIERSGIEYALSFRLKNLL